MQVLSSVINTCYQFVESNIWHWSQPSLISGYHETLFSNNLVEYNRFPVLDASFGEKRSPAGHLSSPLFSLLNLDHLHMCICQVSILPLKWLLIFSMPLLTYKYTFPSTILSLKCHSTGNQGMILPINFPLTLYLVLFFHKNKAGFEIFNLYP